MFIGLGYGSARDRAELERIMRAEPDAIIADIRISPRSRLPGWSGRALARRWPGRYIHLPALGNRRYRERHVADQPPMEIVDLAGGLAALRRLAATHSLIILLCGCSDSRRCHRRVILEMWEKARKGEPS